MRRTLLTTALLASSLATAQSPGVRANIYSLDIAPETQELVANYEVDLGFPLGKRTGSLELACGSKGVPEVNAWRESDLDQYEKDPEGTRGILASKVVQVNGSSALIRGWYGDLRFFCKSGVLYTDFSRIAASAEAQGKINNTQATFTVQQDAMLGTVRFRYPLVSSRREDGAIMPRGMTIELSSTGGLRGGQKKFSDIYVTDVAREGKAAVFLLDQKANVLLPLRYGGNDSGIRKVLGKTAGTLITVYYTPDYGRDSGWRRLTIDLANSLMWTQDTGKPDAKFGN